MPASAGLTLTTAPVASLTSYRTERRLSALLKGYDDLEVQMAAADRALLHFAATDDVDSWRQAMLALLDANLGAATMRAIFSISERWTWRPVDDLVAIAGSLRQIGREAGSSATLGLLEVLPDCLRHLPTSDDLRRVFVALEHLAKQAPESVNVVARRLSGLLQSLDSQGFELWLTGGLRTCGASARRRRAYFALDDPSVSLPSGNDYARLGPRLAMGVAALWGQRLPMRAVKARRATLVGHVLGLPQGFAGVSGQAADRLYWAAMAHAGAHLALSTHRFPVGTLRPLQVALISLVEDARVERLASLEMPGLGRLWRPYHTAQPLGQSTAADLLARLSRALIDPDYRDPHGWVEKGRTLFTAAGAQLGSAGISREIGGLLGNDLGQMRLQFNPQTYVVEPAYRDDNMGLWDFGDLQGEPVDEIEIAAESARIERKEREDGKPEERIDTNSPHARSHETVISDGILVARYPEWDYELNRARPDWTTVRESEAELSRAEARPAGTSGAGRVARKVAAIARSAAIGRRIRQRRQIEGDLIDIDASIAAMIDRRGRLPPDPRVFQTETAGPRELSLLLLIDMSQSTADGGRDGRSVLSIEREAASILGAAFDAAQDSLAIHGFNSDGRDKVRYVRFKGFAEPMDEVVTSRLRATTSAFSTRLGAALRHAGTYLQQRRSFRRVLLVLTDGEPSDVDVEDPRYLVEDSRHAVLALRRSGIDVLAFGLGQGSFRALERVMGPKRSLRVPRIESLPERVMQLYAQLKA